MCSLNSIYLTSLAWAVVDIRCCLARFFHIGTKSNILCNVSIFEWYAWRLATRRKSLASFCPTEVSTTFWTICEKIRIQLRRKCLVTGEIHRLHLEVTARRRRIPMTHMKNSINTYFCKQLFFLYCNWFAFQKTKYLIRQWNKSNRHLMMLECKKSWSNDRKNHHQQKFAAIIGIAEILICNFFPLWFCLIKSNIAQNIY